MAIKSKTKHKKSSTNKGFLVSKNINFKSPRVRFLISILFIALLGAGYFTYKSAAATTVKFKAVHELGNPVVPVPESKNINGKQGQYVARLNGGDSVRWKAGGITKDQKYYACVTGRVSNQAASGKMKIAIIQDKGISFSGDRVHRSDSFGVERWGKYGQYCTGYFTGWGRDDLTVRITNDGKSHIYLGLLSLHRGNKN